MVHFPKSSFLQPEVFKVKNKATRIDALIRINDKTLRTSLYGKAFWIRSFMLVCLVFSYRSCRNDIFKDKNFPNSAWNNRPVFISVPEHHTLPNRIKLKFKPLLKTDKT